MEKLIKHSNGQWSLEIQNHLSDKKFGPGIFSWNHLNAMQDAPSLKHAKGIAHGAVDESTANDVHKKSLKFLIDSAKNKGQLVGFMQDAHLHDPHRKV